MLPLTSIIISPFYFILLLSVQCLSDHKISNILEHQYTNKDCNCDSDLVMTISDIMAVSADELSEPLYFPLRSRRASFPYSLAAASSRTSLSSEGSKSVIVSYKCKQTTNGFFTKKTKESYEGKFQRYIMKDT